MNKKKAAPAAPDVDQYLNFGSDHDNKHAMEVWLNAVQSDLFTDPATPLKSFVELREALMNVSEQPAKVIPVFEQHTGEMSAPQKLFVARHLLRYFEGTVFTVDGNDETFLTGISKPLEAYFTRLDKQVNPTVENANTGDLRRLLKETIRQEMKRLPEYLQSLETKDRVNVLCKMLPYVFPRIEAVHLSEGEPLTFL